MVLLNHVVMVEPVPMKFGREIDNDQLKKKPFFTFLFPVFSR